MVWFLNAIQKRDIDHSKTGQKWSGFWMPFQNQTIRPFENRTLKCLVFECFQYSNVQFLDPHCIWIPDRHSDPMLCNFSVFNFRFFLWPKNLKKTQKNISNFWTNSRGTLKPIESLRLILTSRSLIRH